MAKPKSEQDWRAGLQAGGLALERRFELAEVARAKDAAEGVLEIELSYASAEALQDWPGMYLELGHGDGEVRMGRMQSGAAPATDGHRGDQVGVVTKAWIRDQKSRARVRFGSGARSQEIGRDAADGVRRNVSVDAVIHRAVLVEKKEDGTERWRAVDWEPLGFAFVATPRDASVGVGRSAHEQNPQIEVKTMNEQEKAELKAKIEREAAEVAQRDMTGRVAGMLTLARRHQCPELVDEALKNGWTLEAFQGKLLERVTSAPPAPAGKPNADASGASGQEARRFSLWRAIQCMAGGKPVDGLERELSDATGKALGRGTSGIFVPREVQDQWLPGRGVERAMAANTFAAGGSAVATNAGSFIELLRNKTVVLAAGARELRDLTGDLSFPRQTSGATVNTKAEAAQETGSDLATDDVKATPHRLAAMVIVSKQLLAQSSVDMEMLIRDDLTTQAAIKRDYLALYGNGAAGQPVGVKNATGVGTVTFSAAATYAKVVEMESTVETANALLGNMGYITSPSAKGKWKTKSVDAGSGVFIWAPDNTVAGYRAFASAQIADHLAFFGNWADLLLCSWAGLEVTVDVYTRADYGQVRIILEQHVDNVIRHPGSFVVSTDSAAQ